VSKKTKKIKLTDEEIELLETGDVAVNFNSTLKK
jgi:hypothetical protein